jgi:hypothetical protein
MVSPPPARVKALVLAMAMAMRLGAFTELVEFENADRAVPDHRAGLHDDVDQFLGRLRADVEDHVVVGHGAGAPCHGRLRRHRNSCRRPRRRNRHAPRASSWPSAAWPWAPGRPRTATCRSFLPEALQEGVGDAAADDQLVDLGRQRFRARSAWSIPWSRRRWPPSGAPGGPAPWSALRVRRRRRGRRRRSGRTCPCRRSWLRRGARCRKASITQTSHSAAIFCDSLFVALLLALVAAAVFQHDDFAGLDFEAAVDPVLDQANRLAEQFGHALGDRLASESSA